MKQLRLAKYHCIRLDGRAPLLNNWKDACKWWHKILHVTFIWARAWVHVARSCYCYCYYLSSKRKWKVVKSYCSPLPSLETATPLQTSYLWWSLFSYYQQNRKWIQASQGTLPIFANIMLDPCWTPELFSFAHDWRRDSGEPGEIVCPD